MGTTAEPLVISALEHFSYCPHQCALVHLKSVWDENVFTTRGRHVHESVHEEGTEFIEGERHEELQLCAQAVCLEEMFGVTIARGARYWHASRKRQEVEITED
jgi:CRISPR-associated exonuclease Cas4